MQVPHDEGLANHMTQVMRRRLRGRLRSVRAGSVRGKLYLSRENDLIPSGTAF